MVQNKNFASNDGIKRIEHFLLEKKLGSGAFATAYQAHDNDNSRQVCVKVFKEDDDDVEKSFMVELEAGKMQITHPNVLKIYGVGRNNLIEGETDLGERYFVVTEVCDNGELFEFVTACKGFEENVARTLFLQICDSVNVLHQNGAAHRDLKLENIFLDKNCAPKLADFGLMKKFRKSNGEEVLLRTALGTQGYMAPEVVNQEKYEGPPIDVFACGVMLFMMVTGKPPFSDHCDDFHKYLLQKPRECCDRRHITISD
jgi:serine/threonine protein kinase